ncbi:MAG: hypothetical protein LBT48_03205 [Prevotellaceae bacterium]|jgi:hypothetical protein|nr:hypothetical protein [Prevotellaceae bacterium]
MRKFYGCILFFISALSCGTQSEKVEQAILKQLDCYPVSTLQDIYKNFYQDKFGAEHAIPNEVAARNYLMYELENMPQIFDIHPIEEIGWRHDFVRVHLAVVKTNIVPAEELLQAFLESAVFTAAAQISWVEEWAEIVSIIEKKELQIENFAHDKDTITQLLHENPYVALHHSDVYSNTYHPHYRIIAKEVYRKRLAKYFVNIQ